MRRTATLGLLVATALALGADARALAPGADARAVAPGAPPPGYVQARAAIVHEGRAVARLIAAGDARGLVARFAPDYAREVPEAAVRELLGEVLAAGPVGKRRGEGALPLSRRQRGYAADHAHGGGVLAIEVLFDARRRITSLLLRRRTPLPPDPAGGREVRLRFPLSGTWWVFWAARTSAATTTRSRPTNATHTTW